MRVENLKIIGSWSDVLDAARVTRDKKQSGKTPTRKWKRAALLAEHSPIRMMWITWTWVDLPSWVSVHYVRHKIGVEHFVRSQRSDITGINRNRLPQDSPVKHKIMANLQAILNMARKRLCMKASDETRRSFELFLDQLKLVEPEIASACVPECEYRGGNCPEFESCGKCKRLNNA